MAPSTTMRAGPSPCLSNAIVVPSSELTVSTVCGHLDPAAAKGSARDHDCDREMLVWTVGLGHRLASGGAFGVEHGLAGADRAEVRCVGVGPARPASDLGRAGHRSLLENRGGGPRDVPYQGRPGYRVGVHKGHPDRVAAPHVE